MTESSLFGPVKIQVPPDPSLSRVLRLAASGMASLAEFSVDEIEDIKVAVSEVLIALIEHGEGNSVEVEFAVEDHSFTVRGNTAVVNFDTEHSDLILSRTVLSEVCASHGIEVVDDHAHIWAAVTHATIE